MRTTRDREIQFRRPAADAAGGMAPGKRTLTEAYQETAAVQRKGGGDGDHGDAGGDVHAAAARGVAGSGGALPHLDLIQRSFGPGHDVSGIRAHTDGAAREASAEMGAEGFATGNDVAFAGAPDLHLAAHEAAHVVQQRAGVQLAGGVGEAGDTYERNADEVADRVVAGESAADLLPPAQGGGGGEVQHKAAAPAEEPEAAPGGEHGLEADESDEESAANVTLAPGKPPGAVQKKGKGKGGSLRANASGARALTIQQATVRYAPLVFLAPGEKHGPSDASQFIDNSSLRWSHDSGRDDHSIADQGRVDEDRLGDGGYSHQTEGLFSGHGGPHIRSNQNVRPKDGGGDGGDEGFFLDLDNSKREGVNTSAPVYHEAVDRRFITYWFFYAYNRGPSGIGNHEGDWERIVVKLDSRNRATHVAYYQHDGPPETKAWTAVPKQGTHPIVYSAKGSHASYASPGKKDLHPLGIKAPGIKDEAGRGRQWRTWNKMRSIKGQAWYGYGGGWGEVGNVKTTTGPQGPSPFKAPAPKGW